jgi:alpha-ketoglutarate-dependent taurine dioxygenase
MEVSSLPEWSLENVPPVTPGPGVDFPFLIRPADADRSLSGWLGDNQESFEDHLAKFGAVLLRGFDLPDEASFERAARSICPSLEPRYGDLVKRPSADFVYDATWYPTNRAILFHNEGSHTAELPTRQMFFCAQDEFSAGETPIVDSRRVYEALSADVRRPFEDRGLVYVRNFIRGVDVSWQDFFRTQSRADVERRSAAQGVELTWKKDGSLRTLTRVPAVVRHPRLGEPSFCNQVLLHHVACLDAKTRAALHSLLGPEDLPRDVRFGDGQPISADIIGEILKTETRLSVRFTWQRGDLLVLDNLSAAHARRPFNGQRKILVAVGGMTTRSADLAWNSRSNGVR